MIVLAFMLAGALQIGLGTVRTGDDPVRLAAAHRLRIANGSETTLEERVKQAATRALVSETMECAAVANALPQHRGPDCVKVAARHDDDLAKLPAALPALVEQMRAVEERAYAKRFTAVEMDTVAQFFESPVWRNVAPQLDGVNDEAGVALRLLLRTTLAGTSLVPASSSKTRDIR